MARRFLRVLLLLALTSCAQSPTISFGEVCESDDACTTRLCVSDGTTHAGQGRCTQSCGPATPCPSGWSCSALTARGIAVCARGSGVPELQLDSTRR